jgi:toluene monooxygenase system protein B
MADPQPVPINARFGNDFVTQLVLVLDTDTMAEVAQKVAHHVVGRRIAPRDLPMAVKYDGKVVPNDKTVAAAGVLPMRNVYVDYVES